MSEPVAGDLHNADELGQYRSLSSLSILALCLGLASPLILASPFWSILSVLGVAAGILALLKIEASDGSMTGALFAKTGVALSVASFLLPISRDYVHSTVTVGQARAVAERWLEDIASGNSRAAAELVLPKSLFDMTVPPPGPGQPSTPTYKPEDGIEKFASSDMVQRLEQADSLESFTFLPAQTIISSSGTFLNIQCVYAFDAGSSDEENCFVLLTRRHSPSGALVWFVKEWQIEPDDAT